MLVYIIKKKESKLQGNFFQSWKIQTKVSKINDKFLIRIRKRVHLMHWKEFALEDKRIVKLMARAGKHRNRVLKRKCFALMKRQIKPAFEVLPVR